MWDPDTHPGSWPAVRSYSKKRAARDNQTLTAQEGRARAIRRWREAAPRAPGSPAVHAGDATPDEAPIARARSPAGFKGHVTFHPIPSDECR